MIHRVTRWWLFPLGSVAAMAGLTVWLLACGPFFDPLRTVQAIAPARPVDYDRGEVGVVRPRFARRYLVTAYRRFAGRPAIAGSRDSPAPGASPSGQVEPSPIRQWARIQDSLLGTKMSAANDSGLDLLHFKKTPDGYVEFENCPDAAFAHAVRTANARSTQFGDASPRLREWARAQAAVFANCHDDAFVLPAAAPPSADPIFRADRAYQIAAAYFYAMQFDQAEQRFRAIAADGSSPWRPYGRYLAARANIRLATVPDTAKDRVPELFGKAEADLRSVLADPAAAEIHRSARGLLDFIAFRIHPIDRLHAVSSALRTASDIAEQDVIDYTLLMDRFVGNTVDYAYPSQEIGGEIIRDDDLTDWVLAVQGQGAGAVSRAAGRWKETRSTVWLAAALWQMPADHPDAAAALEAARAIDRRSPAFPTLAFLRVRLLVRRGQSEEARTLLATLPKKPDADFSAEAINLLNAERFMLAQTFEELLAWAPRTIVEDGAGRGLDVPLDKPVFDEDAGAVFSERLPLDRLVDAAVSTALPDRLRVRVAMAAFSRAFLLGRDDAAGRLVPVLRTLAPALRSDLDRYANAAARDRHIAALLLHLRTPGMHGNVKGLDDNVSYIAAEPMRTFDNYRDNWWCAFDQKPVREPPDSEVVRLLYGSQPVPFPVFVPPADREAVARERAALVALGTAPNYLAAEAVTWARARPGDPDAAEALARAVQATRLGCRDDKTGVASRSAFDTLHRLFPKSEWAARTKYWYK